MKKIQSNIGNIVLLSVTNFIQTPAIKHEPKRTFHALYYKQRLYYSSQSNVNRCMLKRYSLFSHEYFHDCFCLVGIGWYRPEEVLEFSFIRQRRARRLVADLRQLEY